MLIFIDNSIDIMCLTKKEIETIVRIAREIYGWNVEVYLFGSLLSRSPKNVGCKW